MTSLLETAGGTVCDLSGHDLQYNKADQHIPEFLVISAQDKALCVYNWAHENSCLDKNI